MRGLFSRIGGYLKQIHTLAEARISSRHILFGAVAFLYLSLFILPWTLIYRVSDETIYLLNAKRILEGEVTYRDFTHITFPGTELVYLTLFKFFGPKAWISGAVLLVLGVSLTWLSVVISTKLLNGLSVFLPAVLFLVFAFRFSLYATHHWFSILAVMGALAVSTSPTPPAGPGSCCARSCCEN